MTVGSLWVERVRMIGPAKHAHMTAELMRQRLERASFMWRYHENDNVDVSLLGDFRCVWECRVDRVRIYSVMNLRWQSPIVVKRIDCEKLQQCQDLELLCSKKLFSIGWRACHKFPDQTILTPPSIQHTPRRSSCYLSTITFLAILRFQDYLCERLYRDNEIRRND